MKRTRFYFYENLDRSEKIKISKIERHIQGCIINIKKDFFEIGKLLHEAKKILPHGSFLPWIEKTFADDLPYSTAYFYMRIYETFKNQAGKLNYLSMKDLLFLTQKDFPEDALEIINEHIEENDSIESWELAQVKNFFDLMKEGTVGGNKFLQQVRQILKDGKKLSEEVRKNKNKHRMNSNTRRTLYFGLADILKKLDCAISQANEMAGLFPFDPNDPEHQEVIEFIHKVMEKLQRLEKELTGGDGMLKPVSTESGTKYL